MGIGDVFVWNCVNRTKCHWVMNLVGPGIDVLDGMGVSTPKGKGRLGGGFVHLLKWIFVVHRQREMYSTRVQKFLIFPHGQYINGIVI